MTAISANDTDTLAVMNDDILPGTSSPGDTRYQRDVSWIRYVSEQKTNDEEAQRNVSYLDK